jgi:hypothetical protein
MTKEMKMLTVDQYNNLDEAISLATDPRGCFYVAGGMPACVIAQLFVLEGGEVEKLKQMEGESISSISDACMGPLRRYPRQLLVRLQSEWDTGSGTEHELKDKMRVIVSTFSEEE